MTVYQGRPAVATIGRDRRPFACHVCGGTVFTALRTELEKILQVRSWQGNAAFSLACTECGYLHTFLEGAVELWPAADGYPAPA